ncbi:PDZ domain-containing protein [Actinomadura sp. HBU206391]|uniref:YlbL family protein n=1 Tax=Actinomadura sp. HBU206391 TaxID=2731692 RepID=UPI00165001C0|nr:PDZ domain-containing protein [Actinomadura sp. HBU206391]MBC6462003.1 PDZ domain-containing protein [Actinomadura sp. HBU206391]
MSRRAATLVVTSILVLVLGLVGALIPVPYVALTPGPTTNTLGTGEKGMPLIQIEGRQVYPHKGNLNFTTVAYRGGPGNRIDLFTALRGWLDSKTAIVPEETVFPKNETVKQVEQENTLQMENSQQSAVAAALAELKIPVGNTVSVMAVQKGMPADGRLRKDDHLVAIDGTKAENVDAVKSAISGKKAGEKVSVTYERAGVERKVDLTTVAAPTDKSQAVVGVTLRDSFKFPFKVKITVGDVGGPSAGLMFSLAIFDKLTPGSLTGGRFIAGTGTITPEGEVGPIGGIQQKMIAAREAGATAFLTPARNCVEAAQAAPKGLRLIKADTLHSAVTSLDALRTGQGTVPACPRS